MIVGGIHSFQKTARFINKRKTSHILKKEELDDLKPTFQSKY